MYLRICFAVVLAYIAAGCAHTKKHVTLSELTEQLKSAIEQKVSTRPGVESITDLKIVKAGEKNGKAEFTYQLTYVSESASAGTVSNSIVGDIHLEKGANEHWNVTSVRPKTQELVFQDAVEVVAKKKTVN